VDEGEHAPLVGEGARDIVERGRFVKGGIDRLEIIARRVAAGLAACSITRRAELQALSRSARSRASHRIQASALAPATKRRP
jgi:hypothetical protein